MLPEVFVVDTQLWNKDFLHISVACLLISMPVTCANVHTSSMEHFVDMPFRKFSLHILSVLSWSCRYWSYGVIEWDGI